MREGLPGLPDMWRTELQMLFAPAPLDGGRVLRRFSFEWSK
jgi:hypothetical protein